MIFSLWNSRPIEFCFLVALGLIALRTTVVLYPISSTNALVYRWISWGVIHYVMSLPEGKVHYP